MCQLLHDLTECLDLPALAHRACLATAGRYDDVDVHAYVGRRPFAEYSEGLPRIRLTRHLDRLPKDRSADQRSAAMWSCARPTRSCKTSLPASADASEGRPMMPLDV